MLPAPNERGKQLMSQAATRGNSGLIMSSIDAA